MYRSALAALSQSTNGSLIGSHVPSDRNTESGPVGRDLVIQGSFDRELDWHRRRQPAVTASALEESTSPIRVSAPSAVERPPAIFLMAVARRTYQIAVYCNSEHYARHEQLPQFLCEMKPVVENTCRISLPRAPSCRAVAPDQARALLAADIAHPPTSPADSAGPAVGEGISNELIPTSRGKSSHGEMSW